MIQVTARYTPSTNAVHRLHPKTSRHTLYAWYHAVHRSTTVVHPDTPKTLRNTACIVSSGTPQHQCSTLGYTQEHCGTHCMHSTIRYTPNTTAVHPVTLQKIAAHLYSEYHAVHPEHHNNTPDYTFRTSQHTLYTQYYAVHPEYHYSTPSYTQKHCGTPVFRVPCGTPRAPRGRCRTRSGPETRAATVSRSCASRQLPPRPTTTAYLNNFRFRSSSGSPSTGSRSRPRSRPSSRSSRRRQRRRWSKNVDDRGQEDGR